eukprot:Plantae.Rhodophyta-Hildenbrandia_rubra.ctg16570.p1 GENE.Plantae.Rhodophyta-Hildenbrandia_rubra.ctg16570~~Plantae.Rhodophyta-Hildenbrandia_rubra.ctg16570.p1  ORF type:complete len:677 (+),score=105.84 Plantae.Rhodophyta-Hildenbrandia_rubra.ctg16570:45-2033(+)
MAVLSPSLAPLVDDNELKWIFVGGKGGVGKTTTACSLSVALATKGKSVLLISTDPAHNLSDAFDQKFEREPTPVNGITNLQAMEVEPPSSTEGLPQSVNENLGIPREALQAMNQLMTMIPGIDEAMSFGALIKYVDSLDYDVVVFDTAPTGHTMRLLSFPNMLKKALGVLRSLTNQFGPMLSTMSASMGMQDTIPPDVAQILIRKIEELLVVVDKVERQFQDKNRTTFVCVCIAEFLSVYETERLCQELGKLGMNVRNIVVNQLFLPPLSPSLYHARCKMQSKYLSQIHELYGEDFHITKLPLLPAEVRGVSSLKKFGTLILKESPSFGVTSEGAGEAEYAASLKNLIDQGLRWIFVGGKGGVGKTTTSCSLATALEASGKRVLIVSTDPAHNLSDAFVTRIASGLSPTKVSGYNSLFAMEVSPEAATENFFGEFAESINVGDVIPRNILKEIASSVPGIDEAVAFGQIFKLVERMDFDVVVFDTAPTGHTMRLLALPEALGKGINKLQELQTRMRPMLSMVEGSSPELAGKIREAEEKLTETKRTIEQVHKILTDPEKCTFVCVAIAEFLSVYETERLVQEVVRLEMDVHNIVVNQLLDPEEKDVIQTLEARAEMQKKYVDQVRELYPSEDFHVVLMPLLDGEVRGIEALKRYGRIAMKGS